MLRCSNPSAPGDATILEIADELEMYGCDISGYGVLGVGLGSRVLRNIPSLTYMPKKK